MKNKIVGEKNFGRLFLSKNIKFCRTCSTLFSEKGIEPYISYSI